MSGVENVIAKLESENIDILVASTPENVFYTCGLKTPIPSECYSIISREAGGPYIVLSSGSSAILVDHQLAYEDLFTYGDYYIYEAENLSNSQKRVVDINSKNNEDSALDALFAALDSLDDGTGTVAFETGSLPAGTLHAIESRLGKENITSAGEILDDCRRIKSEREVDLLSTAVSITEASIAASLEQVTPGMSERELAAIYKKELLDRGAEPHFCQIGFGAHTANSCLPGDTVLKKGDVIRYDVGGTYENYTSDIARTFMYKTSDPALEEKYDILNDGLDEAISLIRDGADTREVFQETVNHIRDAGASRGVDSLANYQRHHIGHDIGLEIYDTTVINDESSTLQSGMTLCVETPYYEIGTAGVQVEDEVLVTDDGVIRLSNTPASLEVVE